MRFTRDELSIIYQYAAPTKNETILGMKEIIPILEKKGNREMKEIVESAVRKLQDAQMPETEYNRLTGDIKATFIAERDNSIKKRLADAEIRAEKRQTTLKGHDLNGEERFLPEARHMVTVRILNENSPVGSTGERYRFFLSDEGYRNTRESEGRGEIKIDSHARVSAGQIYPDKKPQSR